MSCAQLRNNLPQAPSLSKSFRRLFIFFTMLIIAFALDSFIVRAQTTLQAPDSNSFNTALILAHLGDTIVLTAGQTYKDINPLPFKNESCPTNRTCYITIRSSAITSLPASDVRVSPADAVNMPKIITY